jgi:TonB family protein
MNPIALAARVSAVAILLTFAFGVLPAPSNASPPQSETLLVKFDAPVYPQIARLGHIEGDLVLTVVLNRDGTVKSAVVVSGPPLLAEAALLSARQSQFECRTCDESSPSVELKYTFRLMEEAPCATTEIGSNGVAPATNQLIPSVSYSRNHITVTEFSICLVDPAATKVRAAKCLYLWKCGSR